MDNLLIYFVLVSFLLGGYFVFLEVDFLFAYFKHKLNNR